MYGRVNMQSLINCIKILVVILTLLQQLDGKSADYETEFKINKKGVRETESVLAFFDSFVNTKLQAENKINGKTKGENKVTSALERIKTRLHQGLSESIKLDKDSENEDDIKLSFSSLNPYFGNNTKFFDWMIGKLRVELHSNLQNCVPETKSDFSDWVDEHLNIYSETTNGICIIRL